MIPGTSRLLKKGLRCHCEALSAEAISLFSKDLRLRLLRFARNDWVREFFITLLDVWSEVDVQLAGVNQSDSNVVDCHMIYWTKKDVATIVVEPLTAFHAVRPSQRDRELYE